MLDAAKNIGKEMSGLWSYSILSPNRDFNTVIGITNSNTNKSHVLIVGWRAVLMSLILALPC